jgi:GWxTD domain-containing protein
MTKYTLFLFILFSCFIQRASAQKLQANFDYCQFHSPKQGNYVETYLAINGNSLHYVEQKNGTFSGEVEVTLIFSKGKKLSQFKKYIVRSPAIEDLAQLKPIFIDQQRILLDTGTYSFEIQLRDINSKEDRFTANQEITISWEYLGMSISDIQLFDSIYRVDAPTAFSKSGYEIVPYFSTFYPASVSKLGFYAEIYNSNLMLDSNEKYLITYFIENNESGSVVGDYKGFKKKKVQDVNAIANSFLIKDLPSGNYNLVIEARDKENKLLLSNKLFFQRSNPAISTFTPEEKAGTFVEQFTNADTLAEYINCLEPISDHLEVGFAENQLDVGNLELMQQYFLNFWVKRDPEHPEQRWNEYYDLVIKVNKNYSTSIQPGYLTDRGYRYLKYGPPNTIDQRYFEPGKYPYEIWHYYKMDEGQANRRFVFWSPKAVTNDFQLLHSDAIGEIRNPQWKLKLVVGNAAMPGNQEQTKPTNHFGSDTDYLFGD